MKAIIILFCLMSFSYVNAQEISGKIKGHKKAEMDVVLMPFGMDNWISIGKVNKKGEFTADLGLAKIDGVSEELLSVSTGVLYFSFYFSCSDNGKFGEHTEKPAMRQDYVRLTKGGQWAGTAFLVSDEGLIPWLEDSGYKNAIQGSFYEVIYVEEDLILDFTCHDQVPITSEDIVETVYRFKIDLKKGFNWVEYTIQDVYETNPDVRASFPSKVLISNVQDPTKMQWIGKYY
ncbi:MAG: hypothetical protein ACFCUU_15965 [Cyclobacteriaceae bacterium]